jgi:predicted MFS family arabinose efflux permease
MVLLERIQLYSFVFGAGLLDEIAQQLHVHIPIFALLATLLELE